VDDSGQVTQASENDVNQQITAASPLEKDTKGRKEDGENDLANITRQIISIPFLFFSTQPPQIPEVSLASSPPVTRKGLTWQ